MPHGEIPRSPRRLPFRGTFGDHRPRRSRRWRCLRAAMPSHVGLRPLKAWRYVGVYAPELMLCAAQRPDRPGPAGASGRSGTGRRRRLHERTRARARARPARAAAGCDVATAGCTIDLALDEEPGIETVCRIGRELRVDPQAGRDPRATGPCSSTARADPARRARGDRRHGRRTTSAHTSWRWSAGVGRADDGRALAWNLVSGVNDPPSASERTVWVDGDAREVGAVGLRRRPAASVDGLRFPRRGGARAPRQPAAVRSSYRQPFGTFAGGSRPASRSPRATG